MIGNPVIQDLAAKIGIQVNTPQGAAKIDNLVNTYAGGYAQDMLQKALNPNSMDLAMNRRIQQKIFGGKAFL